MPAKKKAKCSMNWMHWLFLLGLVIAILGTIFVTWNWVIPVLLILGLAIGIGQLWRTTEPLKFLVGVIGFVLIVMATGYVVYQPVVNFLQYVLLLVAPGTVLVAFKSFWESY